MCVLTIDPNGNLTNTGDINILASHKLRINGSTGTISLSLGGAGSVSIDAPNIVGGRFMINDNGNTGINVPNPSYKLQVGGDIFSSNTMNAPTLKEDGINLNVKYLTSNSIQNYLIKSTTI